MKYTIHSIDVIKNRNTPKPPCEKDWRNYDQIVSDNIMIKTGCRAPHWNTSQNLTKCYKKEQMKNFTDIPTYTNLHFDPPCRVIDRLHYTYHEKEYLQESKGK